MLSKCSVSVQIFIFSSYNYPIVILLTKAVKEDMQPLYSSSLNQPEYIK